MPGKVLEMDSTVRFQGPWSSADWRSVNSLWPLRGSPGHSADCRSVNLLWPCEGSPGHSPVAFWRSTNLLWPLWGSPGHSPAIWNKLQLKLRSLQYYPLFDRTWQDCPEEDPSASSPKHSPATPMQKRSGAVQTVSFAQTFQTQHPRHHRRGRAAFGLLLSRGWNVVCEASRVGPGDQDIEDHWRARGKRPGWRHHCRQR